MSKRKKILQKTVNSQFFDNNIMNDLTFDFYLRCLTKLCLSIFEWNNLPKGINQRFLEQILFYNGQASLLYDEKYGFINTASVNSGNLNLYGLSTRYNCYSYGYSSIRKLYTGLKNEDEKKIKLYHLF